MKRNYVPDRGDLVWLNFSPQRGHEQRGRRPAYVLSPKRYNTRVGSVLCCPVTKQSKGYPFEVTLPGGLPIEGVILSDQLKSLDWRQREAEMITALAPDVFEEVTGKFRVLID